MPSVLVQLILRIDGYFYANNDLLDGRQVDIWYGEIIMIQCQISLTNRQNWFVSSDPSNQIEQPRRGVCRDFNSTNGCRLGDKCRYKHLCSYHFARKVHASHSLLDCKEAKKA